MKTRLIVTIVTSLLDEVAIVAGIIWLLPKVGINLPLWATIVCVVAFAIFAVIMFRVGNETLSKKPLIGLTDMVGMEGKTTCVLDPQGNIKIEGELWSACSEKGRIEARCNVIVISQNGLKLGVKPK